MIKKIILLFIMTACCRPEEQRIMDIAIKHEEKLRHHFMGHRAGDISSLINETRSISQKLKREGFLKVANRFDSYADVLIYGNRTLNESVQDMFNLVEHGVRVCDYRKCIPNPFLCH